jgi:hypothetical protein
VLRRLHRRGTESALIIPVPEAEAVVGEWRARHDPSAAGGMPAHVTVLYPFVPPQSIDDRTKEALGTLTASVRRFRFDLARLGRFPGVLFIDPEPVHPFVELVERVCERWPQHPPYGGQFDSVVPHLTVSQGTEPNGLAARLNEELPIPAEARELHLMTQADDGRWSVQAKFPLAEPAE